MPGMKRYRLNGDPGPQLAYDEVWRDSDGRICPHPALLHPDQDVVRDYNRQADDYTRSEAFDAFPTEGVEMRSTKFTRSRRAHDQSGSFEELCQAVAQLSTEERADLMEFIRACDDDEVGYDSRRGQDRRRARDEAGPEDFPGMPRPGGSMSGEDRRGAYDAMPRTRVQSLSETFPFVRNIRNLG